MKTNSEIFRESIVQALVKLHPRDQLKNPVMFTTYCGALLVTVLCILKEDTDPFDLQMALWLWFTVLFANFAESLAEGRGKAQADSLRRARSQAQARRLKDGKEELVGASLLRKGDVCVCESGDMIPADGEVIEGISSIDESAITGESAPVIRESGGDRSAVTGGTRVISDRVLVRITAEPGHNFLDRMINLVEGAQRAKTPNEIALSMLLSALTIIFLLSVVFLKVVAEYSAQAAGQDISSGVNIMTLTSLLVCLIPTTIGGLLSAIGISGMDRLIRRNVIATSGRAVEAAGDIDVLLMDKTGTITLGNRMATDFYPAPGVDEKHFAELAQLASLSDETPEGRSIVVLAKNKFDLRARQLNPQEARFVPFMAQTRMSGLDEVSPDGKILRQLRKGAGDAIEGWIVAQGGQFPHPVRLRIEEIAKKGGTPLVVAEGKEILGVVHLKDIIKGGIKDRFLELRRMGIRTIMITGDNPMTAAAIAAEAGVDDFMAQATPEAKLRRIREEQAKGHLVAMTGDGTNDAPALAQSDVGVAMNTGTQAAREAGNMVDLDSNPTKLIEIVEIGKQLLMTRGALTTFSVANDVAKYFAILPAMFGPLYMMNVIEGGSGQWGPLGALNLMQLTSPHSAILSAVIFNALIIVLLIPLALRGVNYRAMGASQLLKRNVLVYGLGGLVTPFVGIKLIDILIVSFGWIKVAP